MAAQTVSFEYDQTNNILFAVDDYEIKTKADVDAFWKLYRDQLERIGRPVYLVTKIDGLYIDPALDACYGKMAHDVSGRWFISFARYGETAVGRMGIQNAAIKADFVTSVHKTREQAIQAVEKMETGRQGR
jgi:hypothetical protein